MRVISGSARGTKLNAPEGINTRPTTDRIKESLFNIIAFDLYECDFLDLFSGSGAIGIEALSRGANNAVFVDENKDSIKVINSNLNKTNLLTKASVINMDAQSAIKSLSNKNAKFDIIFMDPPYNKDLIYNTLKIILKCNVLNKDGYIITEQSLDEDVNDIDGFKIIRVKNYRTTKMTFFQLSNNWCL